jgi:protein O-GlcNAc transferase
MSALLMRKLRAVTQSLQRGNPDEALRQTDDILQKTPRNAEALTYRGIALSMLGLYDEAVIPLRNAVTLAPDAGMALEYLGFALLHSGQPAEAEIHLQRAARQAGAPASVWLRLGLAILHQDRAGDAVAPLQKALQLAPDVPDTRLAWGRVMTATGNIEQAVAAFEETLRIDPGQADASFNIGVLHMQRGNASDAQAAFERTLAVAPRHADAMVNLGILSEQRTDFVTAASWFDKALAIEPRHPHALCNLGSLTLRAGNADAAMHRYSAALQIDASLPTAMEGAAQACRALGRYPEAIHWLRQLLVVEPAVATHHAALSECMLQTGQLNAADASAAEALALDPSLAWAWSLRAQTRLLAGEPAAAIALLEAGFAQTNDSGLLGMLSQRLRHICDWPRARDAWTRLKPRLLAGEDAGSPFPLLCEDLTAAEICRYTAQWAKRRFLAPVPAPARTSLAGGERIRIAYFSSDFQEHPAAYLITEVLECHDRAAFEVFAYSYGPDDTGPMRQRIRAAVDHFIEIAWEPDDVVIRRIVDDRIDILIDLKGYTVGDRLGVMAARPAPVQITWLGYPGTTGADFIDYLIADSYIIREGEESSCTEQVIRLPNCYQPIDRKRVIAPSRSRGEYGLPAEGPVLCCFNQTFKITPDIFSVWMDVLRASPQASLWLVDDNTESTANLRAAAVAAGIASDRLVFAPRVLLGEHLARYRVADLALDTFPYTSHTTASDALWCGCPLLAMTGDTFAARVSGSILSAAGMPDLIADNLNTYRDRLQTLLANPVHLSALRQRVADARTQSPFFDTAQFTRDLERLIIGLLPHPSPQSGQ